jgi:GNAT superfamily N-acetyltransferase
VDGGALRIETGLATEIRRYVFPIYTRDIGALAARITEPLILIKAPMPESAVAAQLPPHWHVERTGTMMTVDALPGEGSTLPPGITAMTEWRDAVFFVTMTAENGSLIGQGRMTMIDGYALHDRINVDQAHRRRGLGCAITRLLGLEARRHGVDRGILVATDVGRVLYETLGWQARAPWTTAQIKR